MRAPLDVLTAVGRALATSRDEEAALGTLARQLVPAMADCVSVTVREDGGRPRRVAVVHADPTLTEAAAALAAEPVAVPLVAGRPILLEDASDQVLAGLGVDPRSRTLYARLGCRSLAALPLVARERVLGGMVLLQGSSGRRFGPDDLPVLEDLARRCATAVDAARLRRRAEQAAAELDTLLATAPVAMALVGHDGRFRRLNDAMAALAGRVADDCAGRAVADALPDLAGALGGVLARAASGEQVADAEVVGPAGSALGGRVWLASAYPVPGGDDPAPTGLVLVEVTAERRAAAQQAAVAELGQRALAGAPVDELVEQAARLLAEVGATLVDPGQAPVEGDVPVLGPGPGGPRVARLAPRPAGARSADDAAFVRSVAAALAAAVARRRAEEEVADRRRYLLLALQAGGMGSFEWDLGTGEVHWSETLATAVGIGLGPEHPVAAVLERVHPDDRERVQAAVLGAVEAGTGFAVTFRVLAGDGAVRWIEARGSVVSGRVLGLAVDVTDRRRAEEVERDARERLSFLADASVALAQSLDAAGVLVTLAELAVPRLADWCIVDALDDGGRLTTAAVAHRDPAMVEVLLEARRRRLAAGDPALWSARAVAATGTPQLVPSIGDRRLAEVAADDDHLALLRRLDPRSVVVVPLPARGRVLGAVTFGLSGGDRRYGPDDLALARDLAGRAALAFDTARLFEERSRVAETLRRSLLPPALPDVPGVEVTARYRPATESGDISGDFYDVFGMAGGAWAAVIGDVCGKGATAAALTGLFRHTVRAAAVREASPARVLAAVNDALLGQVDESRFGSAVLVRLVLGSGGAVATVASGGHPLPVVVRAGGQVAQLPVPGTVLGVVADPVLEERGVALGPGDAVVLYTDGVTEARRGTEQFGEDRLLAVLAGAAGGTADALADAVERAAVDFAGGRAGDDLAVLVLRIAP